MSVNNFTPPVSQPNRWQQIIMLLAILYWISPVDLVPFFPGDDLIVMVLGYLAYSKPVAMDGDE